MRDGLVNYSDDLTTLMVNIDSVRQHPNNYNNGDVEKIVESMETTVMYRPIYVQKSTGFIFAGNHTWEACKILGATKIPVIYSDLTDEQTKRVLIGDNELARLARPDDHALIALLEELQGTELGVQGTGHSDDSIDRLRLRLEELNDAPLGFGQTPGALANPHRCPECNYEWEGVCRPPTENDF